MQPTLRSIVVFTTGVAASGAALLAACGFPSPVLGDPYSVGEDGGEIEDGAVSGDAVASTPSNPDAHVSRGSSRRIDSSDCRTCDCDNDGYPNRKKRGCEDAGPPDAGNDCEDEYPDVHPGQTEFTQEERPPHGGDRNCDGVVEWLYKDVNVTCPSFVDPKCPDTTGFVHQPACGERDAYVACKPRFLSCAIDESEILYPPQGCR